MNEEVSEKKYGLGTMVSYGFGSLGREFLAFAFNAWVFFYYHTEIGLSEWIVSLAFVIFAVWNMVNDPLLGWLTNRPFKFTRNWGRRFPWILIGGIPWAITYLLLFIPPVTDPSGGNEWILFAWLLIMMCLFDTFHSLFFVNFQSLFPDKFRSLKLRRKASGVQIFVGIFGVALGAILPGLIIVDGHLPSYILQGIFAAIIGVVAFLAAIPGTSEDPIMVAQYLENYDEKAEKPSFFKSLKYAIGLKVFMAFMVLYTLYQSMVTSMTGSVPYVVQYILLEDLSSTTVIFAGFLLGVVVSSPIWTWLSHKINDNRKVMIIAGFLLAAFVSPMIFLPPVLIYWVIIMFVWGIALGGFWVMIFPVMSDVIDLTIAETGKREEGVYTGIQQFFGRLGIVIQSITYALAFHFTGFVEGGDVSVQPPTAEIGIRIIVAIAPMIFILVGTIVFTIYFKLTPDKISHNQEMIRQLKI